MTPVYLHAPEPLTISGQLDMAAWEHEPRNAHGEWTSEGGLAKDALAAVDRNLARFGEHSSSPVHDEPLQPPVLSYFTRQLDQMSGRLRKKADKERWAKDKGVQFTRYALDKDSHVPGTKVFVASAKPARPGPGDLAGAISFYEHEEAGERFVHVDYLGTTGVAAGAGTALAHAVAKYAAARGLGVMGEPENEGAQAFWTKIGWHGDPMGLGATTFAGWTPGEAKAVAARGG